MLLNACKIYGLCLKDLLTNWYLRGTYNKLDYTDNSIRRGYVKRQNSSD